MTAAPSGADEPDPLIQVNVRIPRSLRDAIDSRRATVNGGISRDKWAAAAFVFALREGQARKPSPTRTGPGIRTAPPPHRR